MHILIWHGWLLEGSGSNIGAARTAEVWRAAGHDVVLLCQERHPERYPWIDSDGLVDGDGPRELTDRARGDAVGRCVLLRPTIGKTLPVFVVDRYEGFDDVRRFVDLSDDELESYLWANVDALRAAATWHRSDVVVTGHAIPGAAIGRRALGAGRYVAKVHGSDLEYAVRLQDRLGDLAREGLSGARAVLGPANEVLGEPPRKITQRLERTQHPASVGALLGCSRVGTQRQPAAARLLRLCRAHSGQIIVTPRRCVPMPIASRPIRFADRVSGPGRR